MRQKFPNTEFLWSVFSCIKSEYRKIRTRKNSVFGHFSRSDLGKEKEYCKTFHLRLLTTKNNDRILRKLDKILFWSHLGLFLQNFFLQIFLFLNFYCCLKFQKKANEQILRKSGYRSTSRRIYGQIWIHKTSPVRSLKTG